MTPCEEYMENPDLHPEHLATCPSCRTLEQELDATIEMRPVAVSTDALPMAPWEGASHRTWPLVAAGAGAVLSLAFALFLASGTSSLRAIAEAVVASFPSLGVLLRFFELTGLATHNLPTLWHVGIAVLFVVINTVLVLLLRRAPRRADV